MYVDFLQLTSAEVEKNRLSIDIIGLREVGWPESGKQKKGQTYLRCADTNDADTNNRYDIAVLKYIEKSKNFIQYSICV